MPTGGINIICDANISSLTSGNFASKLPMNTTQHDAMTGSSVRTFVNLDSKNWQQGGVTTVVSPTSASPPLFSELQSNNNTTQGEINRSRPGSRGGGRKPSHRMVKEEDLSVEEEERRRVRRERNKQAAARCRKRRVDQTESLQEQVNDWEHKKSLLQEEIHALQAQKEELQFILDAHKSVCRKTQFHSNTQSLNLISNNQSTNSTAPKVVVKSEPQTEGTVTFFRHEEAMELDLTKNNSTTILQEKPKRPQSLEFNLPKGSNLMRSIGVSIDTPTNIVKSLNFEALMDGRTGLTPTNVLTPISIALSENSINTPSITIPSGTSGQGKSFLELRSSQNIGELTSPNSAGQKLICL